MKYTYNDNNTVSVTFSAEELASVNDALSERIHLSVKADGHPVRGYLGQADEELARELEKATYQILCSLDERCREDEEVESPK